jgi:hypothetical protein
MKPESPWGALTGNVAKRKAKMPIHRPRSGSISGVWGPVLGSRALALSVCALAPFAAGCGEEEETRILDPVQVAMDENITPVYEDEEMSIYEVKRSVAFPIIAPNDEAMAALQNNPMEPYDRQPWITLEDVRVQLSWTVTNLDDVQHTVQIIIDPWNEFGWYYPGLTLVDAEEGEYLPNLSGIDRRFVLDGANKGKYSRRQGVFTYEDLDEMARDFATVMALIDNPPTSLPGGGMLEEGETALPTYVNHAFDEQNHSERDPLTRPWVPGVVAGLTGIDMGLRTTEPARIALEVVVEITDQGTGKVRQEGENDALLPKNDTIITIATQ